MFFCALISHHRDIFLKYFVILCMFRNAPIHLDGIGESGDGLHHRLSEANQKLETTVTTLDHKINSIVEIMQQHQLEIKVIH